MKNYITVFEPNKHRSICFYTKLLILGMHCLQLSILIGCPKLILSLILLQNTKPSREGNQIKTNKIFKEMILTHSERSSYM